MGAHLLPSNQKATAELYFTDLPKSQFKKGIELTEKRWTKCVEHLTDYIEKSHFYNYQLYFLFLLCKRFNWPL